MLLLGPPCVFSGPRSALFVDQLHGLAAFHSHVINKLMIRNNRLAF